MGISMVSVTGSAAVAALALPATAMVLRTPPATPARSAMVDVLRRRGFRWLRMGAEWDMGQPLPGSSGYPQETWGAPQLSVLPAERAAREPLLTPQRANRAVVIMRVITGFPRYARIAHGIPPQWAVGQALDSVVGGDVAQVTERSLRQLRPARS
ncbi:hypothetical protein GCM10010295_07990 [Streptomyces intermedius]